MLTPTTIYSKLLILKRVRESFGSILTYKSRRAADKKDEGKVGSHGTAAGPREPIFQ